MPVDPTQTTVLRRRYARDLRRRYSEINTQIRKGIGERDLFQIEWQRRPRLQADPVPSSVVFGTDDEKTQEFMDWLREQLSSNVLVAIDPANNTYIRAAYRRGIKKANSEARRDGARFPKRSTEFYANQPVHRNQLQLLYTRNYEALQGVNAATSRQIARELTQGFAEGDNPNALARRLTNRIDTVGKTRATVLARTEVIHAHAEGALDRYEDLGVENVMADVELLTAGDPRVCPECASLEGRSLTIEEARGTIPVHPQCRCSWRIVPGQFT